RHFGDTDESSSTSVTLGFFQKVQGVGFIAPPYDVLALNFGKKTFWTHGRKFVHFGHLGFFPKCSGSWLFCTSL
ncbi:hypothetical protein J0J29_23885, partial [Vibrio vulnificus]|uniref:hypothetical protein n=1 Tax=Vibrio vulnificus TaxID=672 RepID=UPI0019D44D9B